MIPPKLTVAKDSHFFIALCQYKTHSFVNAGIILNKEARLLASFGKVSAIEPTCAYFIKTLFSQTKAHIRNEPLIGNGNIDATPVTYKAYEISYRQYVEFLLYMKQIAKNQQSPSLTAYCPSPDKAAITLVWQSLDCLEDAENLNNNDQHQHLNLITNSCRHSALTLLRQGTGLKHPGRGVSSFFFKQLPLTTTLETDAMGLDDSLYLLPLPPEAYAVPDSPLHNILQPLYLRLDNLTVSHQANPLTRQKFSAIKALYQSLTQSQPTSMALLLERLTAWVKNNQTLIGSHRQSHWISFPTATEKVFDALLKDVAAQTKIAF